MRYESGSAFRRALEDRLRQKSIQTGIPLVRLRKMVAFDRFLARLTRLYPNEWILKGGFALQLRLGSKARTTKDIDILMFDRDQDIYQVLRISGSVDLNDWFSFEVSISEGKPIELVSKRFSVSALLDTRPFEQFHVDIGLDDVVLESPDYLVSPPALSFADIQPITIPCYPLAQQVAEKLHAYTRLHPSGESSRVKDLVDLLLIGSLSKFDAERLKRAVKITFSQRKTHNLPKNLPYPPKSWELSFKKLSREVGVDFETLDAAYSALIQFLGPILSDETVEAWDNERWLWR